MNSASRRRFLRRAAAAAGASAAASVLPPAIRRALAVPADRRTGTLADVQHIVVFMQENRSFDHYFGTMRGVRGFGDRFPIPVPDVGRLERPTVWYQRGEDANGAEPRLLAPQRNDTRADFALMRTAGTPHLFPDAQDAWDGGRMTRWPQAKHDASMVYYAEADLPFQFALANAFTICDAYHASFFGGTNPNRCFLFTGTNRGRDDAGRADVFNGPAMDNAYNQLAGGAVPGGYTWTTYPERLEAAGVSWQVYQNQEHEFYALNPLLGFRAFRDAYRASTPVAAPTRTPMQRALYEKGIRTRDLDLLKADVTAGRLPQVAWICATASGSEHPSASSPAQGAAYTARVLDALTANPEVWSRTVLIINFDENDGFFDHVPPPAPPSLVRTEADAGHAARAGASTIDTADEYLGRSDGGNAAVDGYRDRPFGLGPRVPMYVISPWSKGGWVNSQVCDHTSTIRFIEKRFGVAEPNISAWRRAVTGDLTSCFDFSQRNDADLVARLPRTATLDAASRRLARTTEPSIAPQPSLPVQRAGARPSRALDYDLGVSGAVAPSGAVIELTFRNTGGCGAVFHVYDRNHLSDVPRRYTVEAGKASTDAWRLEGERGAYDLWVLGPNGFHRHFTGTRPDAGRDAEIEAAGDARTGELVVTLRNTGRAACVFKLADNAYYAGSSRATTVEASAAAVETWALHASGHWYDFTVTVEGLTGFARRLAGRVETKAHGTSDPAMGGPASGTQLPIVAA